MGLKAYASSADLTNTPLATNFSKSNMASSTHIHNFPNEILEKVFQEATRGRTPPSSKQAPYNISHVCDRWRTIALHPKFWENIVVKDSSVRGVKFFRLFLKHALHQLELRLASVTYHGRSGGNHQEDWDVPEPLADLSELKFMRFIAQNVNAEHSVWREIVLNFGFHGPLRSDSLVASQGRFVTLGPFPSIERLLLTAPTDCSATIQSHLDLSNNQQLPFEATGIFMTACPPSHSTAGLRSRA